MTRSRHIIAPRIAYGPEEDAIIRTLFPVNPTADVAELIDRTASSVAQRAARLGIVKCPRYLATKAHRRNGHEPASIAHRFKPGQVPANKGLRRPGWAPGRMAAHQFRPGRKPHTWKPIGSFRYSKEGYLQRKVTDTGYPPRDWRAEHILLWEEHLGPLPAGFAVCFKNGDKADIRIDNLALVSRADLMRRNSYHNYPKPIARLIQLRGAVVRQINRRSRNEQQQ